MDQELKELIAKQLGENAREGEEIWASIEEYDKAQLQQETLDFYIGVSIFGIGAIIIGLISVYIYNKLEDRGWKKRLRRSQERHELGIKTRAAINRLSDIS